MKADLEKANKIAAEAKTELAQCKFEIVNLEEVLEQHRKKIMILYTGQAQQGLSVH